VRLSFAPVASAIAGNRNVVDVLSGNVRSSLMPVVRMALQKFWK
jgi:hypothetical protein